MVEPVIPGNDSAWGNLSPLAKGKFVVDSSSNITAAGQSLASLEERKINGVLDFFGLGTPSIKEQRDAENKAAGVNKGDSELEKKIKLSNFFNVDTQAQPQTVTDQLITHLKQQGINVKDKAAMEEFLKTHCKLPIFRTARD